MGKFITFFCIFLSFFNKGFVAEEVPITAEYRVDVMWATAYQVSIKLSNPTSSVIDSWTASFTLPEKNALSAHISGAEVVSSQGVITVKNTSSNGKILPNESVTFNAIINMPQSGKTTVEQLTALGNVSGVVPPVGQLAAPVLNSIVKTSEKDYVVAWSSVPDATRYDLEVSTDSQFSSPTVVSQANSTSFTVTNQANGTYYYRVAAVNASGKSPYSLVKSITLGSPTSEVALSATYKSDPVWATAFQVNVTLTNRTSVPVKGWEATFTLPANYSLSSHVFSTQASVNGQVVTLKNIASNETIPPNGSVTFGVILLKPNTAPAVIQNLQGKGKVTSTVPVEIPTAPILEVASGANGSYTISWNSVSGATSYTLQEDVDQNFTNPKTVASGDLLSQTFINKPTGTYHYRVFATNTAGDSPFSNVDSFTVVNDTPIPPSDTIEYSEWYITWTSWFTRPYVIPKNTNMINIFVGKFIYDENGKPSMGGFGTMTKEIMKDFVKYLNEQQPPIKAKVSIGGGGGSYDHTWDILTPANVKAFAQGMVDYCHEVGLVGVDFDYESFSSREQEALVGTLIKEFKLLDPNLQTSLCSNAGFGPYFPWQASVKAILDASTISPGNNALDRFYIMTYYNTMADEIGWVVGADGKGGWANWLISEYGFTRARISIGIDDFDAHAYDPDVFRAWAISEGFSVAHWAFDPARPPQ